MKHTPGLWAYGPRSGHIYSRETGRHIADMNRNGMDTCPDWVEADAILIAAAPDMAELLAELADHADRYGGVPKSATKLWDRVRGVLVKSGVTP